MRMHMVAVGVVTSMLLAVVAGCSNDEASAPAPAPNVVDASTDASTEETGTAPDPLMIDDMEHADEGQILKIDGRDGSWFTANNTINEPGSTTTQWPAMGQPFPYDSPGAHGSAKAAHTYGVTDPKGTWGAVMGINFRGDGTPYDASKYGGISFWAKSDKAPVLASLGVGDTRTSDSQSGGECVGSSCNDAFGATMPIGATWEKHSYKWCQLRQAGWGGAQKDLLVPELLSVTFGFPAGETYDLWIDDLAFLPGPAAPCVDGGWAGPPDAASFCSGPATDALIDDMSGPNINFTPPACGTKGNWSLFGDGTFTTPAPASGTAPGSSAYSCGSLCENLYSPLPSGFPGAIAVGDAGTVVSDAGDGGTPGPMAMCIAGTTTTTPWDGLGMGLQFAYAGTPPDGGPYWDNSVSVPLLALIDASSYAGVQFWLWFSPDTVAAASPKLEVWLGDRNETGGFGVCNENASTAGPSSCGPAGAAITGGTYDKAGAAGPLFGGDGGVLPALYAGWQLVKIPWASFQLNEFWGGANETVLDPKTLTWLGFWVTPDAGGAAFPFNFCVYQVSFYK